MSIGKRTYTNDPLPRSQPAAWFTHLYFTGTTVSTDWFAGTNKAITSFFVALETPLQDTYTWTVFEYSTGSETLETFIHVLNQKIMLIIKKYCKGGEDSSVQKVNTYRAAKTTKIKWYKTSPDGCVQSRQSRITQGRPWPCRHLWCWCYSLLAECLAQTLLVQMIKGKVLSRWLRALCQVEGSHWGPSVRETKIQFRLK